MTIANEDVVIELTPVRIKLSQFMESTKTDGSSVELLYMGRVSPHSRFSDQPVVGIDYSISREEFGQKASEIIEQIKTAFSDLRGVHVLHRTGFVASNNLTVIIMVKGIHRADTIQAFDLIARRIRKEAGAIKREIFGMNC